MFSIRWHLLMLYGRSGALINGVNKSHRKFMHINNASSDTNYYDALEISRDSTQSDIKAAYYKLSKQFHPDKNQGCQNAARKFREISQAYEVLGNFRSRRLYDKGISPQIERESRYSRQPVPDVEDDPQTKFYKSRFKKSVVTDASGQTPIYNFDEWSRAHYGETFNRRQKAKAEYHRYHNRQHEKILTTQNEIVIVSILVTIALIYGFFRDDASLDTPMERTKPEEQENQNNSDIVETKEAS